MAGRAKGEVKVREWKSGRGFALRFSAYGERRYVTLGSERDGWDQRSAEEELENILVDVRRGVWVPPTRKKKERRNGGGGQGEVPRLGPFASDLVEKRRGQVAKSTTQHEEWMLSHLVPYFGDWALPEIDIEAVDEYRQFKVAEAESRAAAIERGRPKRNLHGQVLRPLAPSTINRTIGFLLGALDRARIRLRHPQRRRRQATAPARAAPRAGPPRHRRAD